MSEPSTVIFVVAIMLSTALGAFNLHAVAAIVAAVGLVAFLVAVRRESA